VILIAMRLVLQIVFRAALLSVGALVDAQEKPAEHKPVIVSTTYPKDSRGETVYDEQDEAQKGTPVVPGILVHPEPFHRAKPRIPVSSRMHHRKLNIIVEGVITANGDMIDVHFLKEDADSAMAQSVAEAYGHLKFRPATLDGKPVAVLLQAEFKYNFF
jgi:Gram-negative bacterial TonB protein C-terminal